MPEEIDIACPGCSAVFGVPIELSGETAECAECGVIFEIPSLEAGSGNMESTDTGAIKGVEADGDTTNTVRLSRTGIGMIPQVKDSFTLGGAPSGGMMGSAPAQKKKKSAPRPSTPSAPPKPAAPPKKSMKKAKSPSTTAPTTTDQKPQKKIVLPAWAKIRLSKDEDVEGLQESESSAVPAAVVAAIIAAVAGGAGLMKDAVGGTMIAGIIVLIAAIAAFVVVMMMGKAKVAVILTSLRAVTIIGSKKIEVKK